MFKQSTVASLSLTLLATTTWAQPASGGSQVSIYGLLDVGIEHARTRGGGQSAHLSSVASGSNAASRIGVLVREDLGGGMYAGARLESGIDADTGTNTSAAKFWDRASYVSLGGRWGELRVGREYTPAFHALQQVDINGMNLYGNAGTFTQIGPSNFTRTDNALNYVSPALWHTTLRLTYGLGEERSASPRDAGRFRGISAVFDRESLLLAAYYQVRRDLVTPESISSDQASFRGFVGRWSGGAYAIGGGLARWDPAGPDTATSGKVDSWWVGGSLKVGLSGEAKVQMGRMQRAVPSAADARGALYAASYLHTLSKRTALYATYGQLDNDAGAAFRLAASSRAVPLPVASGTDTRGMTIGMTHRF